MSGFPSIDEMLKQWRAARVRTLLARTFDERAELVAADCWTELRLGTEISREVLAGRWAAVAELLRLDAVTSWAQVGEALDITETEAVDGFRRWVSGQRDLLRRTGSHGFTDAEADELVALAEAVQR